MPHPLITADETMEIAVRGGKIEGTLSIPEAAVGTVLFAHGSGSSRHSGRNRFVARVLQDASLATLLIDLLTQEEEQVDNVTREHRFDIDLLTNRLLAATEWLSGYRPTRNLPVGYFGASTGAAAALRAAAEWPACGAVVSRGGRPDLAGNQLSKVVADTLHCGGARLPSIAAEPASLS